MNIVVNGLRGVAVAVLLGGAVLAGPGSAHAMLEDCDIGFVPNKPMVVIGSAWAACDVPPEQHEMRLGLDFRQGGQWRSVRLTSDPRIPTRARMSYIVKAECAPGAWRIEAEAVGTLRGRPFDFAEFSETRIVSAAECARGDR
jgi:hypothetical protein